MIEDEELSITYSEFCAWAERHGWLQIEHVRQADGAGNAWSYYEWVTPSGVMLTVHVYSEGDISVQRIDA